MSFAKRSASPAMNLPASSGVVTKDSKAAPWNLSRTSLVPQREVGELLEIFIEAVPEAGLRNAILAGNPARLYGFEAWESPGVLLLLK